MNDFGEPLQYGKLERVSVQNHHCFWKNKSFGYQSIQNSTNQSENICINIEISKCFIQVPWKTDDVRQDAKIGRPYIKTPWNTP